MAGKRSSSDGAGSAPAAPFPFGMVLLLGALTAVGPLSVDMYLPAFPFITREFGARPGEVETTLATFLFAMGLCQILYGPLADRFGRRMPLIGGCSLFILGTVACAFSSTIETLAASRLLQGIGGAAGVVIARACVRDLFGERDAARMFSRLMLVMGVAPIIAPWLGGQILLLGGWRDIFYVKAVFGSLCLAAVLWYLPETLPPARRVAGGMRVTFSNFATLLRDRAYVGAILAGGFNSGILFSYIAGSPFVFIELHGLSATQYSYLFGVNAVGIIASSQGNQLLLKRFSPERLLNAALVGNAVAGVALAISIATGWGGFTLMSVLLFLCLSSVGVVFPNLAATALARHGALAGSASALLGASQFLIGALAGTMVGLLNNGTAAAMGGVVAFCGCAGIAVLRFFQRP